MNGWELERLGLAVVWTAAFVSGVLLVLAFCQLAQVCRDRRPADRLGELLFIDPTQRKD